MRHMILLNTALLAALFATQAFAASEAQVAGRHWQGIAAEGHSADGAAATGDASGRGGLERGKPREWTSFPILKIRTSGEGDEGRAVTVVPQGIVANSIAAYSNDVDNAAGRRKLPLEMAGARLDKPESGGFHWLAAREEQKDRVLVASTVHFFSNPGKNPTAMFMQQKHELEIIPQPYPREHSRYRSNEDWKFLVHFNGKPLIKQKVNLETQNGARSELFSDDQGVINVHLPDDLKQEAEQNNAGEHNHGRRSSGFVLATEHAAGGKTYLTAFNGSYGPDAFDQRSLAMGLGFTLLGMAGATPLLRKPRIKRKLPPKPANPQKPQNPKDD